MATVKTTSDITLIIETTDAEFKSKTRLIESVVRTALDNYAAVTSQDVDSKAWNDIVELIRENLEIKVI